MEVDDLDKFKREYHTFDKIASLYTSIADLKNLRFSQIKDTLKESIVSVKTTYQDPKAIDEIKNDFRFDDKE